MEVEIGKKEAGREQRTAVSEREQETRKGAAHCRWRKLDRYSILQETNRRQEKSSTEQQAIKEQHRRSSIVLQEARWCSWQKLRTEKKQEYEETYPGNRNATAYCRQ
jgi:hypothetical protein